MYKTKYLQAYLIKAKKDMDPQCMFNNENRMSLELNQFRNFTKLSHYHSPYQNNKTNIYITAVLK